MAGDRVELSEVLFGAQVKLKFIINPIFFPSYDPINISRVILDVSKAFTELNIRELAQSEGKFEPDILQIKEFITGFADGVVCCRFNDGWVLWAHQFSALVRCKDQCDQQDEASDDSTAESVHTGLSSNIYGRHRAPKRVQSSHDPTHMPHPLSLLMRGTVTVSKQFFASLAWHDSNSNL